MKILKIIDILLLTTLFLIVISCSSKDPVVATVCDSEIHLSQFQKRYENFLLSTGVKDNLSARLGVLNNMINEILLYNYDVNTNIFDDPEYKKEQAWNKRAAVLAYLKDQEIFAKINVTDKELRQAYYRAHVSIAARHLFASTKEEADNLYQLLMAGASFNQLAKQVFTDTTLKNNGGYLGYFSWGDMDPAFENAAFSLKVGEISKPVKTAEGYSIIKVEDRKEIPLMTEDDFQKRKKNLERSIKISKKLPYERAYIAKIFDSNLLKFNNDGLKVLLPMVEAPRQSLLESTKELNIVSATYKEHKYTVLDLLNKLKIIPKYHLLKINSLRKLKIAIKGILISDILYDIAIQKGYDRVPVVKDIYHSMKMITFLKYKMDDIARSTYYPDSAISDYYKKNISVFSKPRKMEVREIIVNSKSLAENIYKWLSKGEDFGKLARKYSIRKWSAENNGIINLSPINDFGMLKDTLWNSKIGSLVGPLNIKGVYGIFRVLRKQDSRPIPLENIKNQVLKRMQQDLKTRTVSDYLKVLRNRNNVEIYYKNLRFVKS